jgi:membrane glycosyltransferase
MAPRPWRGFWNSIGTAVLASASRLLPPRTPKVRPSGLPKPQAWEIAANRRRTVFVMLTLLSTVLAAGLFISAQPEEENTWLQMAQLVLFAVLSAWVVTGFVTALMGFWVLLRGDRHTLTAASVRDHALNPDARTAIIMPICNEDVATVFAGLRATCESLIGTGHAKQFDVFVLSDSYDPAIAAAERSAWEALRAALAEQAGQPPIEVYYRLRTRRTHRKAGNVADFCRRWGKDYDHMVVLDADSVMSGSCLVSMVKLMEANPSAGIIQTATQAIGHATLHARAQQFGSRVTGRLFTLGMQFWQLGESHYWGHNAIIRVEPFMQHCALAPIAGQGGMSGGIMSHDFVEAALMRRAGYHVWLVSDLTGSYEQQPPDLLSELQRDRRWCQGNLQNSRLMAEPGIHRVHRSMFAIGAMSYLSAPMWLAFLAFGTALFVADPSQLPGWYDPSSERLGLWIWTLCLLFLPRLLGLMAVFLKGEQKGFGGTGILLSSALLESALALLQAPIRMVAHSLFVLVAVTGIQLDWKSPPREAVGVAWRGAFAQLAPIAAVIGVLVFGVASLNTEALVWMLPVTLPLLLAVPFTVATGHVALGAWMRARGALLIPEESWSPAVLRRAWRHASRLSLLKTA